MTQDQPRPRRRRRRAGAPAGPPPVAAPAAAAAVPPAAPQVAPVRAPRRDDGGQHGMHGIAGAGPSRVGVSGALRARDVNRPTAADLAEAERALQVVRRNWQPPT